MGLNHIVKVAMTGKPEVGHNFLTMTVAVSISVYDACYLHATIAAVVARASEATDSQIARAAVMASTGDSSGIHVAMAAVVVHSGEEAGSQTTKRRS